MSWPASSAEACKGSAANMSNAADASMRIRLKARDGELKNEVCMADSGME